MMKCGTHSANTGRTYLLLSLQDLDAIVLSGGIVVDPSRNRIGSVEQIFTSGESGAPVFVTVRTGLFGMSESFVPLEGASLDGSVITAAFTKEAITNGPRIDSDRGTITDTQEQELYRFFGLDATHAPSAGSLDAEGGKDTAGVKEVDEARDAAVPLAEGPLAAAPRRPPPGPPPPPPHLHKHVPSPAPAGGPHPVPHLPRPDPAGPRPGPPPDPPPGRRPPGNQLPHQQP